MTTPRSQGSWELTAPESLVLRDGPGAERAMALKLGLLELVARGSLRLVDVEGRNWIGRARVDKVLVSGHRPVPGTGPLAPIGAAYHNTPSRQLPDGTTGRPVAAVAQTLARSGRTAGKRYIHDTVLPELAIRGLYVRQPDRMLGLIPRTRWFLTSDGTQRRAELEAMLRDGERQLVAERSLDRSEAALFLTTAGAAALLMTSAYPELAAVGHDLRRSAAQTGDSGATWAVIPGSSDGEDGPSPGDGPPPEPMPTDSASGWEVDSAAIDLGALDVGSLDLSAFDGIDSAFDAIDSGVDAGGGGDGGGGDGGGGGGD